MRKIARALILVCCTCAALPSFAFWKVLAVDTVAAVLGFPVADFGDGRAHSLGLIETEEAVYGLDRGSHWVAMKNVYGLQLGIFGGGVEENMCGLQLGLFSNGWNKDHELDHCWMNGIQFAPFAVKTATANGFQLSVLYAEAKTVNGLQFAALCSSETLNGIQCGIVNLAESANGVQVGIWNRTEKGTCLQVGVLNLTPGSGLGCLPVINVR